MRSIFARCCCCDSDGFAGLVLVREAKAKEKNEQQHVDKDRPCANCSKQSGAATVHWRGHAIFLHALSLVGAHWLVLQNIAAHFHSRGYARSEVCD